MMTEYISRIDEMESSATRSLYEITDLNLSAVQQKRRYFRRGEPHYDLLMLIL